MISSIKGMKDILPNESSKWQHVEKIIHSLSQLFHFKEIRTPLLENTSLFSRSIGEETDIVSKEMYTFLDRSNESVTLKPEGTASVVRSYIQHHLGEEQPSTKLYYISPMFRQERPQAGRLREFHQYGAEILGSPNAIADSEIILLNAAILKNLGLTNFTLIINSVGCENCRPNYKIKLVNELNNIKNNLTELSKNRIDKNPLRVLDSKDKQDQDALKNIPVIFDYLCESCKSHFEELCQLLKNANQPYSINYKLVRGLDYYTKTAFEFISENLGSQDALSGGGRYDLLTLQLGGKPTPAVGFAGGIERLLIALEKENNNFHSENILQLFLASADEKGKDYIFTLAQHCRNAGISTEFDLLNRSVKSQLREADRQNAKFLILVGEKELTEKSLTIKGMKTNISHSLKIPLQVEELKSIINK